MAGVRKPRLVANNKSIDQHIMDGTYRADRHENIKKNVNADVVWPNKPESLSEKESQIWDMICEYRSNLGALRESDRMVIESYIDACIQYEAIKQKVIVDGYETVDAKGNVKQHHLLNALNALDARKHKWLLELELTPLARTKLKYNESKAENEEEKTDWSQWDT